MSNDAPPSPDSLRAARRLLARAAPPAGTQQSHKAGAALERTCLHVTHTLCDVLGDEGCNALLARALDRTMAGHPSLKQIGRFDHRSLHLDGIQASVEAHGEAAVTAAIEALIAAVIDILGRLIGEDMAIRLIDHDPRRSQKSGGVKAP